MNDGVGRLVETASLLESTVAWLEERQASMSGEVQKIVAAVEQSARERRACGASRSWSASCTKRSSGL